MDEYEKRMMQKAAIENLVSIVNAFKPDTVIVAGKEKLVGDELAGRYVKRWLDMAYNFLDKAELLGSGYADYVIRMLELKRTGDANPQTAS